MDYTMNIYTSGPINLIKSGIDSVPMVSAYPVDTVSVHINAAFNVSPAMLAFHVWDESNNLHVLEMSMEEIKALVFEKGKHS